MTDYKTLYGYDPFHSPAAHTIMLSAMVMMFLAVAWSAALFATGNLAGFILTVIAFAFLIVAIAAIDIANSLRRFRCRVPREYGKVFKSAYGDGWRGHLREAPRATVFAKAMVEMDYADFTANSAKTGHGPRILATGRPYWGFFHDRSQEREDNPVHAAWLAVRVLDERQEPWSSMPRLLALAAMVGRYIAGREPEQARTVAELALAWFDSEMTDDEALDIIATHPAPMARLVLAGVPMEYASAVT